MNDLTDQQLLRDYTERRSEPAFAEIVRRYIDLVYSAAFRMTGEAHSAQDVTQAVFAALAQNASQLARHPVLSGWLHTTARNLAAKNVRAAVRRQTHEQEAAAMNQLLSNARDDLWDQIAPHLDAALGELNEAERDAVLLRYFEKKSALEIADALGISAEAAQKRVTRAVERLREFFSKRNVTIGASGLVVLISAKAVQAAPAALIAIISAAALSGAAVSSSTVIAATKTIAMTTLQKTLVTATVAVLAGAGIYEARQAAQLRDQVQTLQQQQAPLAQQVGQLQSELHTATNRLADLVFENSRLKSTQNESELLKLRSEVSILRQSSTQTNDPDFRAAMAWIARKQKLQTLFDEKPELRIPELRFLSENKWLSLAKDLKLDTDKEIDSAMHQVRLNAKIEAATRIQGALKDFMAAHNGEWPATVDDLKTYLEAPDNDLLQRYRVIDRSQNQAGWLQGMVLIENASVNRWTEPQMAIGPSRSGWAPPPETRHMSFPQELVPVMQSFRSANNDGTPFQKPEDFYKLAPYATTSEQRAALNQMVKTLQDAEAP